MAEEQTQSERGHVRVYDLVIASIGIRQAWEYVGGAKVRKSEDAEIDHRHTRLFAVVAITFSRLSCLVILLWLAKLSRLFGYECYLAHRIAYSTFCFGLFAFMIWLPIQQRRKWIVNLRRCIQRRYMPGFFDDDVVHVVITAIDGPMTYEPQKTLHRFVIAGAWRMLLVNNISFIWLYVPWVIFQVFAFASIFAPDLVERANPYLLAGAVVWAHLIPFIAVTQLKAYEHRWRRLARKHRCLSCDYHLVEIDADPSESVQLIRCPECGLRLARLTNPQHLNEVASRT